MRLPRWFAERSAPAAPEEELRVSTVELFLDLVFVFTVTQLTALLARDFSPADALRAVLAFVLIWWIYGGYCWVTNHVPPVRTTRRVLLFTGMGGFLVIALALPKAFGDGPDGVWFAVGYLVVVLVHTFLYLQASSRALRLLPGNLGATALVFAAAYVDEPWRTGLWVLAVAVLIVSPYFIKQEGFPLHPGHIVERHGLLVIIVLGESIVAIGIGAGDLPLTADLVAAAVLGLALAATFWWMYFSDEAERAEHALLRIADPVRRTRLVLAGYFYAHIPMLLGVVGVAAGLKKLVAHPFDPLYPGPAIALGAGVSLFLVGELLFGRALALGGSPLRSAAAVLALASAGLGLVSGMAQLAVLVLIAGGVAALQRSHAARL
ncbi:low temperature requirement protein A [Bailinhaonella thermotolerans]|nr:low temperature requirement protein A [Bailinhaonella thermotolerans]